VRRITTILSLALTVISLRAEVSLAPIFGDHMVIQQGVTFPVWGTAAPGEKITVSCGGHEARTVADASGKWRVILRPVSFTGEHVELIVNGSNRIEIHDVLPGDVWIAAGEAEMASPLSESAIGTRSAAVPDPGTRFFVHDASGKGRWEMVSAEASPSLPAVPFFFARDLRAVRRIPIGVIDCTTADPAPIASWVSAAGLGGLAASTPVDRSGDASTSAPSALYGKLIKPLLPFAITGVIWGQGASDEGRNALGHRLFLSHLVRDWRRVWEQGPFPFLMLLPQGNGGKDSADGSAVEPYLGERGEPRRARPWIREGMITLRLPNTGVASAADLGADVDQGFDPLVAGRRLALTARHLVYGEEIACSGPVFRDFKIEQNRMRLFFDGVKGGLTLGAAPGSDEDAGFTVHSSLRGFAIRGNDGRWFPAEARIDDGTIVLSSDAVPKPVAARYGWQSHPDGNLYDRAGLPALPFRTDSDQPWAGKAK
jgi:sialate O-acetylesterase